MTTYRFAFVYEVVQMPAVDSVCVADGDGRELLLGRVFHRHGCVGVVREEVVEHLWTFCLGIYEASVRCEFYLIDVDEGSHEAKEEENEPNGLGNCQVGVSNLR